MHYALSIGKHTGQAPFPPELYAISKICILTLCVITISTVQGFSRYVKSEDNVSLSAYNCDRRRVILSRSARDLASDAHDWKFMLTFWSYIRHADRTTVDYSLFPRNHDVVLSFLLSECCCSYAASTFFFDNDDYLLLRVYIEQQSHQILGPVIRRRGGRRRRARRRRRTRQAHPQISRPSRPPHRSRHLALLSC